MAAEQIDLGGREPNRPTAKCDPCTEIKRLATCRWRFAERLERGWTPSAVDRRGGPGGT